jgi:hypothetical protein
MTPNSEDPQDPHGLTFSRSYNTSQKFCLATRGSPFAMAVRELHVCTRLLCTKGSEKIGRRVGPISPILVQLVSLSLSHDTQRETEFLRFEMWVWTEAGIGRRLLWHELSRSCGMENGGEQQQYFHNLLLHNTSTNPFEFLKNWRVLQQMLCESYVLLLKQSICTTHAQNL